MYSKDQHMYTQEVTVHKSNSVEYDGHITNSNNLLYICWQAIRSGS